MRILHDPKLNKGTAFSEDERERLGLRGLLPPHRLTQDEQVAKFLAYLRTTGAGDLDKHIALMGLSERNERLFFRVVQDHLEEAVPLLYTPTVGEACKAFAHIYQRPRGLYLTADDKGRMADVLRNWRESDVRVIVVTDGERILGLGDLGANGMGIPIGKLILYTACAGIDPARCLPVFFDVGTDNDELRHDPLYLGLRQPRLPPDEYDALFAEFVAAVGEVFPRAMIQCEDFAKRNARRLLEAYRERVCLFNDDMQGTAAVALAGLNSALRITGLPWREQRVLFVGAGSAATGICDLLVESLARDGLDEAEARRRCAFFDSRGLVVRGRERVSEETAPYALDLPEVSDLAGAVRAFGPTALVGVSGQAGLFDRSTVCAMAALNERPILFPLSNPTSKAECSAGDAYAWSEGRAVVATGSPFAPVEFEGRRFVPRQGNNAYIFPGVGLGVMASGARGVPQSMFLTAARVLAETVHEDDLAQGSLYPPLAQVREVSLAIAEAVARDAWAAGLAREPEPSDVGALVRSLVYDPTY
ncbi:MAG: NAD-dependent malic enzyme [Planctomycetes bacterium]|nr:NAD-dependent malic enzyme [Planctomycetota bacterium]